MRLLVAEQDPVARSLISSALSSEYEVTSVADGSRAAGAITDAHEYGEPFDVVVLSMALSVQGDNDLLKLIKSFEEPRVAVGGKSSKIVFLAPRTTGTNARHGSFDIPSLIEEINRLTRL